MNKGKSEGRKHRKKERGKKGKEGGREKRRKGKSFKVETQGAQRGGRKRVYKAL